ncbi:hypothetical protein [Aquimarina algiphila]|uniref:Fibronectin type-III domain-containing protein n=1 Tax=Aquimarina algiphila TaxID=2047982 RepID=A0A554VQH5_9FLAO|nr:hypothetical protein [Aquimarina algiphila]TSE10786.1 hypothetical protein FOF46_02795 [Aquimarina algiphila]
MKNNIKLILAIFVLAMLASCGGSDDGPDGEPDGGDGEGTVNIPTAAALIFPLKDAECNAGKIVSNRESTVIFEWNASDFTTKYTLQLTNLNTQEVETFETINTELEITLLLGTPYSWKITSSSSATASTAESEVWKLFNAGPGIENYTPFPAELVSPPMGLTITNPTTVDLLWKGSDVDGDISEYEVYMDNNNPPVTLINTVTKSEIKDVTLQANKIYYWQVVTKDLHNNLTKSSVFEFRTK